MFLSNERTRTGFTLVRLILSIGISSVILLLQPSTSTFILLVIVSLIMAFLSGIKIRYIFLLLLIFIVAGGVLIAIAPYRLARVRAFLNPQHDILGESYQLNQAKIALGLGGFWGMGFGKSIQKYNYLPETIGDSIFAIYAEEFGFIGSFILLSIFLLVIFRGLKIARGAPDNFSYLLICGIISWVMLQSFINIAGISGLIPLTGIPLPFISYGGSALVSLLIASGLILNISKYSAI